MSLMEEYPEEEYERAPKRLKTSEVEEGEELEEGEDSDSASAGLLGDEEEETRRSGGQDRARWSSATYTTKAVRKVRQKLGHTDWERQPEFFKCVCVCVKLQVISHNQKHIIIRVL